MDTEERAFLQGQILRGLEDLTISVTEMREDFRLYKQENYERINQNVQGIIKNSNGIARQKGWMGMIALVAGIAGGFLRGFMFKR